MILRIVRRRTAALAAALVLPLVMAACSSITGPGGSDRESLDRASGRWAALGARSYSFVVGPRCFCGELREIRTTVVNGEVTRRVYVDDGSPVPANFFTGIVSVDAMLATVDQALDKNAAEVDVTYDDRGVPVDATIDYQTNVADEEFGWVVTSLTLAP